MIDDPIPVPNAIVPNLPGDPINQAVNPEVIPDIDPEEEANLDTQFAEAHDDESDDEERLTEQLAFMKPASRTLFALATSGVRAKYIFSDELL